jgi:hypothetical protein
MKNTDRTGIRIGASAGVSTFRQPGGEELPASKARARGRTPRNIDPGSHWLFEPDRPCRWDASNLFELQQSCRRRDSAVENGGRQFAPSIRIGIRATDTRRNQSDQRGKSGDRGAPCTRFGSDSEGGCALSPRPRSDAHIDQHPNLRKDRRMGCGATDRFWDR